MDIFTIFDQKIVLTVLGTSALIQVNILTKRLLNCKSQEQYKNGYKMRVESRASLSRDDSRVYLTRGGHAPVGPVVGLPAAGEVDVEDEVGGVARGVGLPVAALDTWTRGISDTWQD